MASWFQALGLVRNDPGCKTRYEGVGHMTHPNRVSRILSHLLRYFALVGGRGYNVIRGLSFDGRFVIECEVANAG
jgi:hypothetical protein